MLLQVAVETVPLANEAGLPAIIAPPGVTVGVEVGVAVLPATLNVFDSA
jgi:hypothetical protein